MYALENFKTFFKNKEKLNAKFVLNTTFLSILIDTWHFIKYLRIYWIYSRT